ncbi:MAG: MoxR family ATPase [Myxococcales bacterium]|nr:MoxR family ATPase [Myxococcales bacterium]
MTPAELKQYLSTLLDQELKLSVMLWGPPGIGKSSIVAQVAGERGLSLVDLRLGQLAPTDLRGLPVAKDGVAVWYPPEFLPQRGRGILFLDELNMAPPTLQGIAQQLVLDRRVGSYTVPDGWFLWAAGNRKEDRAAVFDMPAPLANRFVHLEARADFDSFRSYAMERGLSADVLSFLSYRPALLHKMDPGQVAWPSPRSWEMAGKLHAAGLDVGPAVGDGPASEFHAFVRLASALPDLEAILGERGQGFSFPTEPSERYALVVGLASRVSSPARAIAGLRWLVDKASTEWLQLFASNVIAKLRASGQVGALAKDVAADPKLKAFLTSFQRGLGA